MDLPVSADLNALFGDVAARRLARMLVARDEGSDRAVAGAAHRVFGNPLAGRKRAHADTHRAPISTLHEHGQTCGAQRLALTRDETLVGIERRNRLEPGQFHDEPREPRGDHFEGAVGQVGLGAAKHLRHGFPGQARTAVGWRGLRHAQQLAGGRGDHFDRHDADGALLPDQGGVGLVGAAGQNGVGGGHRRMPGKGQFAHRGEDSSAVVGLRARGFQDEDGLRKVHLDVRFSA